jgi:IS5 family transposase
MKAHIGADAASGMAHRVAATATDIEKAGELERKDARMVYEGNGYRGLENRPETRLSGIECRINEKKGADREREKENCGDPMGHLEYPGGQTGII